MKLIDLLNAQSVLQEVTERKMPSKLAFCIAKNFRLITQELEDYNKTRLKLLSENWKLNEETNKYDIPDKDQPKWKQMHDDLLNSESDYVPYKVSMELANSVEWSPGELLYLWFIFEGEGASELAPSIK